MPFEGRQRAAVLDRCWSVYLSLTRGLNVPENFHVEFPVTAESALTSGALHLTVAAGGDAILTLREEYVFNRQKLTVSRYSYNLIDASGSNVFRADNLPFHRVDYRRRLLTHPPHHIHDQRGRICSFTGDVHDFITHAKLFLSARERK